MVELFWYSDPENHKGAAVLLVDEPNGDFQEWIRELCPSSVVEYYRSVAGGTRSEVWLLATEEIKEALEDRLDDLNFYDGPYRSEVNRRTIASDHYFNRFPAQPTEDLP